MFKLIRKNRIRAKLSKCGVRLKIFDGVIIHGAGHVTIGDDVALGDYVVIWGGGGVSLGNHVLIAAHSVISSQSHEVSRSIHSKTTYSAPIIIEDNVWLGAGVKVLPGVRIGMNSIIGAGAVVTTSIPENSVAVGVPARVIKTL